MVIMVNSTVDKLALVELVNERMNSACSLLTNMYGGQLNVTEEEVKKVEGIIGKLRDVQIDILHIATKES